MLGKRCKTLFKKDSPKRGYLTNIYAVQDRESHSATAAKVPAAAKVRHVSRGGQLITAQSQRRVLLQLGCKLLAQHRIALGHVSHCMQTRTVSTMLIHIHQWDMRAHGHEAQPASGTTMQRMSSEAVIAAPQMRRISCVQRLSSSISDRRPMKRSCRCQGCNQIDRRSQQHNLNMRWCRGTLLGHKL